jgi:hypothetical protein
MPPRGSKPATASGWSACPHGFAQGQFGRLMVGHGAHCGSRILVFLRTSISVKDHCTEAPEGDRSCDRAARAAGVGCARGSAVPHAQVPVSVLGRCESATIGWSSFLNPSAVV